MENIKQAKTVDEQISILRKRGMKIEDESKAKEVLMDIGFYRLGFYSFPFEKTYPDLDNRTHLFSDGVNFNDILSLYYLDSDLRRVIMHYINRIEVNFRTYLTYRVSNEYKNDPSWFINPQWVTQKYINDFEKKVYSKMRSNPVIARHHKNHPNDQYAPAWKTIEFMTLGNVFSLYNNLKDPNLKTQIAWHYKCNSKVFYSYMETIRVIRNSCAHGACIYNINLPLGIKKGPAGNFGNQAYKHNICGAIKVINYVLENISINRSKEMDDDINKLLANVKGSRLLKEAILKSSGLQVY